MRLAPLIALRGATQNHMVLLKTLFEMADLVKVIMASAFRIHFEGHRPNERDSLINRLL